MTRTRAATKIELAVLAIAIVGAAIWVERAHRTDIDAALPGDMAVLARSAACSDSDNVPYSPRCLTYMSGWFWRANAADGISDTVTR